MHLTTLSLGLEFIMHHQIKTWFKNVKEQVNTETHFSFGTLSHHPFKAEK
jgi:hypothetical protein